MMKFLNYVFLIIMIGLAACSPSATASIANDTETTTDTAVADNSSESNTETSQLSSDYKDALSITGQLAVGTMQLEETDLAVDEIQAAEILPLWQALQALSQSDMAAEAEVEAVLNQIQEEMTPAQIQVIADMALTSESLAELQSSGALVMGGFGRRGGQAPDADSGSAPAGRQGGGPGGLGGTGGGPGGLGAVDEETRATRQAQFANDDGSMQDVLFTGMVVRLLQSKTGETPAFVGRGGNVQDTAVTIVSEVVDLTVDKIQAELADGKTLTEIITENGGDVTAVQAALAEALAETQLAQGQDLDAFITELLNGELNALPGPSTQE